jgi:hypothetical protein
MLHRTLRRVPPVLGLLIAATAMAAPAASATVTVSRAEVNGTQLRLEGPRWPTARSPSTVCPWAPATGAAASGSNATRSPAPQTAPSTSTTARPPPRALASPAAPSPRRLRHPLSRASASAPSSVLGGSSSTGTVTLSSAAPSGGQTVTVSTLTLAGTAASDGSLLGHRESLRDHHRHGRWRRQVVGAHRDQWVPRPLRRCPASASTPPPWWRARQAREP